MWPETFVSESSVQSLVHEIRRAIDDGAAQSSQIRTVHGVGYRFCGPVAANGPAAAEPSQRHAAWLIGASTRVALHAGENIVGRGSDDVVEIEDKTISRHHARIVVGESVTIEDLASKNGTWLDGERLDGPRPLADGASVRLGSVHLTFRLAPQARPTESAADSAPDGAVTILRKISGSSQDSRRARAASFTHGATPLPVERRAFDAYQ